MKTTRIVKTWTPPQALRVAFGDTMDLVKVIYGLHGEPTNGCGPTDPCLTLAASSEGLTFFFKIDKKTLYLIRADEPFAGSIEGVRIGDAFDDVVAKVGQPSGSPFDFDGNKAYDFNLGTGAFRCDCDNSGKCVTIYYER